MHIARPFLINRGLGAPGYNPDQPLELLLLEKLSVTELLVSDVSVTELTELSLIDSVPRELWLLLVIELIELDELSDPLVSLSLLLLTRLLLLVLTSD